MSQELYSIDQVADLLKLHVKTVRNYVRTGRLPAKRIGKQYRITKEDIEALVGRPVAQFEPNAIHSNERVTVTSVVEIDALSREAADRLTTMLMGAIKGRRRDGESARLDAMYDDERNQLKVVVFGGPRWTANLLDLIHDLTVKGRVE